MTRLIFSGFVAAFFAAAMFLPATASAGPAGITKPEAGNALVMEAGWRDRRRNRTTVVDAPTIEISSKGRPSMSTGLRVKESRSICRVRW